MKRFITLLLAVLLVAALVSCAKTEPQDEVYAPTSGYTTDKETAAGVREVSHFGISCTFPEDFIKTDETDKFATYTTKDGLTQIDFDTFDYSEAPQSLTKSNLEQWLEPEDIECVTSVEEMLFGLYDCSRVKFHKELNGLTVVIEQTYIFFDDHVALLTITTPEDGEFKSQLDTFYENIVLE